MSQRDPCNYQAEESFCAFSCLFVAKIKYKEVQLSCVAFPEHHHLPSIQQRSADLGVVVLVG